MTGVRRGCATGEAQQRKLYKDCGECIRENALFANPATAGEFCADYAQRLLSHYDQWSSGPLASNSSTLDQVTKLGTAARPPTYPGATLARSRATRWQSERFSNPNSWRSQTIYAALIVYIVHTKGSRLSLGA